MISYSYFSLLTGEGSTKIEAFARIEFLLFSAAGLLGALQRRVSGNLATGNVAALATK
jgi:hypothetical protein